MRAVVDDDDCFYYHSWRNNVVIAFGTLSSEPDVLVTHLAIQRAGDYNLISWPVVHDGLVRFQASRHDSAQCVPHFLSHEARQQRHRAGGVTRLGPDGVFLYFDLALSSHCGTYSV